MRDSDLIQKVFSLFASSDHAEGIAGDLVQERQDRGLIWFWYHAFAIAAALWATVVTRAPLRTLVVAGVGCVVFAVSAFAGVAAVSLFPNLLGALVAWSLLAIFWWGGALWTGVSVVAVAPIRGVAACVTLVGLGEVLLLALWIVGVRINLMSVTAGILYMTGAGAAWPLLLGAAVARARVNACAKRTPEQQS